MEQSVPLEDEFFTNKFKADGLRMINSIEDEE